MDFFGFSMDKRKRSENTGTKMEYCETKIEMEQRFPEEHPQKWVCEYDFFCFYHGGAGRGEDGVGVPEIAAVTMGAWGTHGGRLEGFEIG